MILFIGSKINLPFWHKLVILNICPTNHIYFVYSRHSNKKANFYPRIPSVRMWRLTIHYSQHDNLPAWIHLYIFLTHRTESYPISTHIVTQFLVSFDPQGASVRHVAQVGAGRVSCVSTVAEIVSYQKLL